MLSLLIGRPITNMIDGQQFSKFRLSDSAELGYHFCDGIEDLAAENGQSMSNLVRYFSGIRKRSQDQKAQNNTYHFSAARLGSNHDRTGRGAVRFLDGVTAMDISCRSCFSCRRSNRPCRERTPGGRGLLTKDIPPRAPALLQYSLAE